MKCDLYKSVLIKEMYILEDVGVSYVMASWLLEFLFSCVTTLNSYILCVLSKFTSFPCYKLCCLLKKIHLYTLFNPKYSYIRTCTSDMDKTKSQAVFKSPGQ